MQSADKILGWREALDCHEQIDPLNAQDSMMEIASIVPELSCKGTK